MTAAADRIERALNSVDGRLSATATIQQDSDGHPLLTAHLLQVNFRFDLDDDYAEETITVGTATVLIDEYADRVDFIERHARRHSGTLQDIVRTLTDARDAADRMLAVFNGKAVAFLTDVRIPNAADALLGTILDSIENSFPLRTVGVTFTLPLTWEADTTQTDVAERHRYQQWSSLHLRQKSVG